MNKLITREEAMKYVQDGTTLMINGFMGCRNPDGLIDALVEKGVKNLTLIANDTAIPGKGIGKMVANHQIRHLIASHIGLNPETGVQINAGEMDVTLVPQGTLAERIRCAGAGIGGFLTPTGLGTEVEVGKQTQTIDGKTYLLELPLKADVALLFGSVVDTHGNVYYKGTAKNFSLVMAMAADVVIVEAEKLVEAGELDPDLVMTPGLFVDYIVKGDA